MVRLKANESNDALVKSVLFQFHYGTIKRVPSKPGIWTFRRFNSTMVRLKVPWLNNSENVILFQFHYGTIKRPDNEKAPRLTTQFQFHYGTIKSSGKCFRREQRLCFNSTMVRLKVRNGVKKFLLIRGFNSTMVRLKGPCVPLFHPPFLVSIPLWYD